jgi:hypothetical protein
VIRSGLGTHEYDAGGRRFPPSAPGRGMERAIRAVMAGIVNVEPKEQRTPTCPRLTPGLLNTPEEVETTLAMIHEMG